MATVIPKTNSQVAGLAPVQSVSGRTGVISTANLATDLNISSLATTAYVDGLVSSVVTFTGTTDCSGNPNYPAATIGDTYVVSVAGKIGGASGVTVAANDVFIANATNAGGTQAAVGASWTVIAHTLLGALLSANNLSDVDDAAAALANLGGQPLSAVLTAVAALTTEAYGLGLLEMADAAAARTELGLGTMSTQGSAGVSITGGTVTGITDLAVADGGTGASTAAGARTNLGLVIGTDVLSPTGDGSGLTGITATVAGLSNVTNHTQTKASVVPNTAPSAGQMLVGNAGGTAYAPLTITGDATISSSGVVTLNDSDGTRAHLGLEIGVDVVSPTGSGAGLTGIVQSQVSGLVTALAGKQPINSTLTTVSSATSPTNITRLANATAATAGQMFYCVDTSTFGVMPSQVYGRSLVNTASSTAARSTLGLGTIATQAASAVSITGGSVTGITDLAVADGGTGASSASGARTNLGLVIGTDVLAPSGNGSSLTGITTSQVSGLGTMATQSASAVAITGGTITGLGTPSGSTDAATKGYVDGLVGSPMTFGGSIDCSTNPNYPAATAGALYVVSVAGKIGGASGISVDVGDSCLAKTTNAGGTQASVGTSWSILEHNLQGALLSANNLSDVSSASSARTNLGLVIGTDVLAPSGNGSSLTGLTNTQISGLGTMSTQASSGVSISGGSITGITDLAVTDGGTGASTASGARTNLGLVIGTDVLAPSGNGSALTGLTTSQISGLGTIATQASSAVSITGGSVTGITDLAVADGGTGASDAATARTNLGVAIGSNVQAYNADLAGIATLNTNGIPARTASGTYSARTITGTTNVITVTNGDGVSGNPTLTVGSLVQRTDTAAVLTAQQNFGAVALTSSSASIAWNLATAQSAKHTFTENTTLANPTNMVDGGTYVLRLTQHASSPKTLAFGSAYKWPSGTAPTISATNGAVDVITFTSDGTNMLGCIQKAFA